jgi:8-oxo-dGTP pyrophosphatase MutT (NUDIX family)
MYPSGEDDATVVLTRRRADLRRHAGEISFPGGRRDPEDVNLLATALREAHEETGLAHSAVRVAGALEPISTIATGYAIYPFVGVIEAGQPWIPQAQEVDEMLEVPLSTLATVYERRRMRIRGITFTTNAFPVTDDLFIWGATGKILVDLILRLGLREPL